MRSSMIRLFSCKLNYRLINASQKLAVTKDLQEFVYQCEQQIREQMGCDICKFFLVDENQQVIITYNEKNEKVRSSCFLGVIGDVIANQRIRITLQPKNDPMVNLLVDINSNLPLLTVPVLKEIYDHKRGNYHDVKAVYQVKIYNVELIFIACEFAGRCKRIEGS